MKSNIFEKLKAQSPFAERQQLEAQFGGLAMRYGDTLPDGGHMTAKLAFGNEDTLKAVAKVIRTVGRQELIADDLERRVKQLPPKVEHDPNDIAQDRLVVYEEEARQIRATIEDLSADMYHTVDDETVSVAKALNGQTYRRGQIPNPVSAEDRAFYQPNNSFHEQETRAFDERQMQQQAQHLDQ